jgi:hypothetical protein
MLFIGVGVARSRVTVSARELHRKQRRDMKRELKPIPGFRNEAEERRFWETHDSSDYVDWSKAKRVHFPNLKRSASPTATNNASKK